jgi:hypothetical protein
MAEVAQSNLEAEVRKMKEVNETMEAAELQQAKLYSDVNIM